MKHIAGVGGDAGLEYARPGAADREESNRIIFDELVNGVFTPEAVASFQRTIERLKARLLRRCGPRLHCNPFDHHRRKLAAADA